jgi:PAS domain S-box-containing protein
MYQKPAARYVPAAVVFCLGVLLTLFVCVLWQRYYHQARVQAEFEHRAVILADVLQSKLIGLLEALESIGDLYSASTEVERGEFESFIQRTVKQHRAIQGLNWVPRVPDERRAEFEIAAQAEGLTNFQFTERNPAGQFIRAGQRAEYFPIYFIAPLVGLRPVLGFDLTSDPARRAILEQARDTGQMAATPPIKLVQGAGQDIGVLILLPIYYPGFPTSTLTERRANLQGFGLLALRMDVAIQEALHGWERSGLTLSLVDEAAPLAAGLLYSEGPPTRANTLRWGRRLPIADRHWRLEFSFLPAGAPWAPRSSLTIGAILTVGLSLTALLSAYLLTAAHHAIRREQATQALGESEARLAAVITSAMDAIITMDHEQRITLFNAAAERMFRCSAAEVLGQTIDRFIPERYGAAPRAHIRHFGTTGETTRAMGTLGTLTGVRMDGEEFPIEASISQVETAGQRFYTVILRDITERQHAEHMHREQAALAALEAEVAKAMARSESLVEM